MGSESLERAVRNLFPKRLFRFEGKSYSLLHLIRDEDQRPLAAEWWRGKSASLLGIESRGNFLLRHCDGSVRLWLHSEQTDHVLAKSVDEFVRQLEVDPTAFP